MPELEAGMVVPPKPVILNLPGVAVSIENVQFDVRDPALLVLKIKKVLSKKKSKPKALMGRGLSDICIAALTKRPDVLSVGLRIKAIAPLSLSSSCSVAV
ncbi:MAG: hypothetical protein ACUVV5_11075, partial [Candidatus Aminicenantales bacterium]